MYSSVIGKAYNGYPFIRSPIKIKSNDVKIEKQMQNCYERQRNVGFKPEENR